MKDLIRREALIDDIDAAMENSGMGYVIGQTLKRYVKRQPAVDAVEVVHAKWEKIGIDYKHEASLYECSVCGKIVRKYWEDERFECCPYCFARMDGDG